jgi:predicted glycoside hydrolase/deacetylase ChbG (UPF0249 family)
LSRRKQLVVNADDFGFTPDVNEGIVEAHRRGILTATTLMANGEAFEDAVRQARETPTLDIGAHLVLVGGRSTLTGKALPETVGKLLGALVRREIRVHEELRAQVRRIVDAGLRPTHLDTHKHTHLAPPVLDAVARVAEEFGIVWVRRPFDFPLNAMPVPPLRRLTSRAMALAGPLFENVLARHGCKTTGHFAGFQITGLFRTAELVELMDAIPEGSTELMCHPGYCREALRNAQTRLKESRERELDALVSRQVRDAVERNGIEVVGYGGLGG